jgi:uncharacterized membrane protein YozB (DUF420 family)
VLNFNTYKGKSSINTISSKNKHKGQQEHKIARNTFRFMLITHTLLTSALLPGLIFAVLPAVSAGG